MGSRVILVLVWSSLELEIPFEEGEGC